MGEVEWADEHGAQLEEMVLFQSCSGKEVPLAAAEEQKVEMQRQLFKAVRAYEGIQIAFAHHGATAFQSVCERDVAHG